MLKKVICELLIFSVLKIPRYFIIGIVLDTSTVFQEQIKHVEDTANELIRLQKKITVTVYTKDTPEEDLKMVMKSP